MWRNKVSRRTLPFTTAKVLLREEKSTDVALAVHLVRDALLKKCDRAIVISNDADFEEAIAVAVEGGIEVFIVNPHKSGTNKRLKKVSTGEFVFSEEMLESSHFPKIVLDEKGRELRCPREWE